MNDEKKEVVLTAKQVGRYPCFSDIKSDVSHAYIRNVCWNVNKRRNLPELKSVSGILISMETTLSSNPGKLLIESGPSAYCVFAFDDA